MKYFKHYNKVYFGVFFSYMAYLIMNMYRIWILNLKATPYAYAYVPFFILLHYTGKWQSKQMKIRHEMIMSTFRGTEYSVKITGVEL